MENPGITSWRIRWSQWAHMHTGQLNIAKVMQRSSVNYYHPSQNITLTTTPLVIKHLIDFWHGEQNWRTDNHGEQTTYG